MSCTTRAKAGEGFNEVLAHGAERSRIVLLGDCERDCVEHSGGTGAAIQAVAREQPLLAAVATVGTDPDLWRVCVHLHGAESNTILRPWQGFDGVLVGGRIRTASARLVEHLVLQGFPMWTLADICSASSAEKAGFPLCLQGHFPVESRWNFRRVEWAGSAVDLQVKSVRLFCRNAGAASW
jgi:hypothetical protein